MSKKNKETLTGYKPLVPSATKTTAIPAMLKEAQETGLITQASLDALEHEKLKAKEKIENFRRQYREQLISFDMMEEGIRKIREGMKEKIIALDFNDAT